MDELVPLSLALMAGLLLGVMFFGGLWWTVQKGVSAKNPALWFFGSLLLRMSIALAGFYFVSGGHWERMLGVSLRICHSTFHGEAACRPAGRTPQLTSEGDWPCT